MSRKTRAEIFIETLEDMLYHDRASRKARLRAEVKAHAKRFMSQFRTLPDGGRRRTTWTSQDSHMAQEITRQAPQK